MFDLIGDIHGHAKPLRQLLEKLGYQHDGDSWAHPDRKVIFLGDFIDRGPHHVEVVEIARSMVETGHAFAIMGNHEFNAIAWATQDENIINEFLRPHTEKNLKQHRELLDQVGENTTQHQEIIEWFKTLPAFLEFEDFRVIHACWHPDHLETLKPHLDQDNKFLSSSWQHVAKKGNEAFDAAEVILKGLEIPLPNGYEFKDKDQVPRTNIRTRWWLTSAKTYQEIAMVSEEVKPQIPKQAIIPHALPGYDNEKPVFIGHYWLTGTPTPLTNHVICLDYSIAAQDENKPGNGKLCAYRWDGCDELSSDNFIWVS